MMRVYHTSSLDEVSCGDYDMSQTAGDEDCLFSVTNALSASCSDRGRRKSGCGVTEDR